ncbi:MAG: hypothetical protein M3281_09410, partial [Chloroflexota bacterium]|nr:hypothetical protein [Chloroflexota bacterium]
MGGNNVFWYVSRAAGLSAYVFLWLDVCLGLAVQRSPGNGPMPRWRIYDLHQFTAPVALGLLAMHVGSLLGDRYIGFTTSQLLVPLTSSYRPFQVALGIIAMYLLLLILASSYL